MIYSYKHSCGWREKVHASIKDGPPPQVKCVCGRGDMERDWQADAPMIDTSGCKDHSDVRPDKRVRSRWDGSSSPEKCESM